MAVGFTVKNYGGLLIFTSSFPIIAKDKNMPGTGGLVVGSTAFNDLELDMEGKGRMGHRFPAAHIVPPHLHIAYVVWFLKSGKLQAETVPQEFAVLQRKICFYFILTILSKIKACFLLLKMVF